jgi:hypothetical protein
MYIRTNLDIEFLIVVHTFVCAYICTDIHTDICTFIYTDIHTASIIFVLAILSILLNKA